MCQPQPRCRCRRCMLWLQVLLVRAIVNSGTLPMSAIQLRQFFVALLFTLRQSNASTVINHEQNTKITQIKRWPLRTSRHTFQKLQCKYSYLLFTNYIVPRDTLLTIPEIKRQNIFKNNGRKFYARHGLFKVIIKSYSPYIYIVWKIAYKQQINYEIHVEFNKHGNNFIFKASQLLLLYRSRSHRF